MPESLFAALKRRMARFEGRAIPFHVGDTYLDPPEAARLGNLGFSCGSDPDLYRYSPAPGKEQLIDAVLARLRRDNGMSWAGFENVQITCGATHALFCALRAVMNHGDQILMLAPHWPLIRGIAVSAGVRPVEVPFSHVLMRQEDAHIPTLLEAFITPETAAIYMSNPNNPDGKVYTAGELQAIAEVARRHNLWVISDEVYERFTFDGRRHLSIANLPGMNERTLTVFSFSKTYGQAGLRVGYLVGPAEATVAVRKMSNHSVYSVPHALQRSALAALETGDGFVADARESYQRARDLAFEKVVAPCARPEGCTYLFLDLTRWCERGEDSCLGVLERLAEAGILLAPGVAFGHLYQKWARLCYTSVPIDTLEEGIDRLNQVLERA
jgi:aspartate/methionine/tyrosine aminotransferase